MAARTSEGNTEFEQLKPVGQKELELNIASLKACLKSVGLIDDGQEKLEQKFQYNRFACMLENETEIPNMKKLIIRPFHSRFTQSLVDLSGLQLSSLSELDLSNVPWISHGYLHMSTRSWMETRHHKRKLPLWCLCNLKKLSVMDSQLTTFPNSVGSLRQLETLNLSKNQLKTLPLSLSFCQNLETLDLQNNDFHLFPSVIMHLENLRTLKRLGNPRIFPHHGWRSRGHAEKIKPVTRVEVHQPMTLLESCAKAIFVKKIDYWNTDRIGVVQCRSLDQLSDQVYICDCCSRLMQNSQNTMFRVDVLLVTFKGLNAVPFVLWACSDRCQELLVQSYRTTNIALEQELDARYRSAMERGQKDLNLGRIDPLPSRTYTYTHVPYIPNVPGRFRVETGTNTEKACSVM